VNARQELLGEVMALPWVRLDCAFPRNPKLLAMLGEKDGHRAALVYVSSLAYAGEQGTDGFVPREALIHIHGRPSEGQLLVKHRFWIEQPGGWLINGWADFQESSEESQGRRKRAQAAAAARWEGHISSTNAERTRRWRESKNAV
jgi:hypothetical protein